MKYTSGMLCRDGVDAGCDFEIAFFPHLSPTMDEKGEWGWWFIHCDDDDWYGWSLKGWRKQYALTPPKPGRCFEVDIEL